MTTLALPRVVLWMALLVLPGRRSPWAVVAPGEGELSRRPRAYRLCRPRESARAPTVAAGQPR